MTGSRPHFLRNIADPLQIGAVGAVGQHRKYVGQKQSDASAAADQLQHDHDCVFAVVLAAVGETSEDLLQTHVGDLFKLACGEVLLGHYFEKFIEGLSAEGGLLFLEGVEGAAEGAEEVLGEGWGTGWQS